MQTAAEAEEAEEVYEVVFPTREVAATCPRVVVRHARDPELEEKQLVHRLHKEMEGAIALHSIGTEGRGRQCMQGGAGVGGQMEGMSRQSPPLG